MKEREEFLIEVKKKFDNAKKEVEFNVSFEELDKIFHLSDSILNMDFIAEDFSRQIRRIIFDYLNSGQEYLLGLIFPNPNSIISQSESKIFSSEKDKKLIWNLIKSSMNFISINSLANLKNDKSLEKKFIDESYLFCKNVFIPELTRIIEKVSFNWAKD
jgi:uncharacterized protein (DUF488 family)